MPRARFRIKAPPPPADGPVIERWPSRQATVGSSSVRRALPHPRRRLIGAWCFLDHFGPSPSTGGGVGAHPHIGLQTVTWLLEGEMFHRDSTGSAQRISPGQLNWMTAGRGIAHAEQSTQPPGSTVHGVQLWVALPDAHRDTAPAFAHHPTLPTFPLGSGQGTVLAGSLGGVTSPAETFSPLLGADLTLPGPRSHTLTLDPAFEHGAVALEGSLSVAGEHLAPGTLLYLGRGRDALAVAGAPEGRMLLLGGAPLGEPVRIWWNFIFRDPEDVRDAVAAWNGRDTERFPDIPGHSGTRIDSPAWHG